MVVGFGATPAAPGAPSLVSQKRNLVLQPSVRPPDKITIEEQRLFLAATVGPYRLAAAGTRNYFLQEGIPAPVAIGKGQNGVPSFVRLELMRGYQPVYLDLALSGQFGGSALLTTQFAGHVDVVLLPSEVLFATAYFVLDIGGTTEIKVLEVLV
jgi:hypothetical protein